jgi:hypothetical protein
MSVSGPSSEDAGDIRVPLELLVSEIAPLSSTECDEEPRAVFAQLQHLHVSGSAHLLEGLSRTSGSTQDYDLSSGSSVMAPELFEDAETVHAFSNPSLPRLLLHGISASTAISTDSPVIGMVSTPIQGQLGSRDSAYAQSTLPNCMTVPESLMEAAIGLPDMDSDCARIMALVETYGSSLVNFQAKKRGGQTALHRAIFHHHVGLVHILLQNGAAVNTSEDRFRSMPLHTAASNGFAGAVDLLVHYGADVNAQSMFGSPLHLAAWYNQTPMALKLLKFGADITARNSNGMNPRDVARSRNHDQVTQLFDRYLTSHEEL